MSLTTEPNPPPVVSLNLLDDPSAGDISDFRSNSLWRLTIRRLFKQRSAVVGMILLSLLVFTAIFASVIAPYDPELVLIGKEDVRKRDAPCIHLLGCPAEKPQHILGIDGNIRDQFSRLIYGTRVSLYVGIITVSFAVIVGTLAAKLEEERQTEAKTAADTATGA